MTDHDGANFNQWDMAADPQTAPDSPSLIIETIEGVEPLDDQFGVDPKKTMPDALYDALFGQPDPTEADLKVTGGDPKVAPTLHTYAILDAAKVPNLPELLASSDLEHRCLFKGQAEDDLRDVAPWIVKLEEGNSFTRNLFTQDTKNPAPWYLWDKEPGIYIRSNATLDDLWKHFRKFTRVEDISEKWFYFRFWEPKVIVHYLTYTAKSADAVSRIFSTKMVVRNISAILVGEDSKLFSFTPNSTSSGHEVKPQKYLTSLEIKAFHEYGLENLAMKIAAKLRKNFAQSLVETDHKSLHDSVLTSIRRMRKLGFNQERYLETLVAWDILFGPEFEVQDGRSLVIETLGKAINEVEKFKEISLLMRTSSLKGSANGR
ncbi:DUF4123 domain-containing protein [Pseudaestuariivita rosea]|uniref:DUF4123 domain-containing protein n=1 Tax=Pseudaestuariivita rosea TaxID=2763263 RepID=UPI001ABAA738|nr:DUF4123 domain-containing protein [Pseudaestuariivita rosea]